MPHLNIPRIVIAGTHSGVGKTTVVTGLLAALRVRGLSVQSYKVGPDYIDPGYHQMAGGRPAHNLDTWLTPPEKLVPIFARTAAGCDLAVIEGVMGLYDGGRHGVSSTAAIAKLLKAPVILVVDARSMGESAAAVVLGYKSYDPEVNIAGVIVNRLGSEAHRQMVVEAIERLGIPVMGTLFRNTALSMPERHLGLTPVTENHAVDTIEAMGCHIAAETKLEQIIAAAGRAQILEFPDTQATKVCSTDVVVAVARDEVFSFYYPESLQVLAEQGVKLAYFSPLRDDKLPEADGLILGGGFPEMFVRELSDNVLMRQAVYAACLAGMPVYAECGGLMYLARKIIDFHGAAYDMAGVVPAVCAMQQKLEAVGYVEVTALADNAVCTAGEKLRGHEFHFSKMLPDNPQAFRWAFDFAKIRTGQRYLGGYAAGNVVASYLHMHFAGNETAARRFAAKCREYRSYRQGRS